MAKTESKKSRQEAGRFRDTRDMTTSEAASYLEELARGVREGNVIVSGGKHGLMLPVAGTVEVEVAARQRKRKGRLELRLTFRAAGQQLDGDDGAGNADGGQPPATLPNEMSF